MPTTSAPWRAPHNGLIGDASSTAAAATVNQYLTTHPGALIYAGNNVVTPQIPYVPFIANPWNQQLNTVDVDQPITMSGTAIGRVTFPVLPVGSGADLLVSLWTDSSGQPGQVIAQTRIPAAWINQLAPVAALSAPSSVAPTTYLTGNPLATAQTYTFGISKAGLGPYNYPASIFSGTSASPSTAWYGSTIYWIGGVSGGAAINGVFSVSIDSSGVPGPSQVQPTFPANNDGSSASVVAIDSSTGSPILVNCGGGTSYEGPTVATCYASEINTTTGNLGTWSSQTALPQAMQSHSMATYNGWVYVVGGRSNGTTTLSSVYFAQVQNGQITSWQTGPALPQATSIAFLSISPTGQMLVAGGATANFSTTYATAYWSQINPATGMPSPWRTAPSLPVAQYYAASEPYCTAFGSMEIGTGTFMPANAYGLAQGWEYYALGNDALPGYVDFGNGQVLGYVFNGTETQYGTLYTNVLPLVSVPLPATGLTNGATYHVMLQQQGGDVGDYLFTVVSQLGYGASGPTVLTSPADTYTWSAGTAHSAVPINVYDTATPSPGPATPLHTWQDNGSRIRQFIIATTPDQQLLGVCEATVEAYALNANTDFSAGLTPWTPVGSTAATSSVQAYQGGVAARVVPSGSATLSYLQSETLACQPGQAVAVSGWMWFTSAVTANASMSINWYTAAGTYISTSSNNVSVPAATWTQLANIFNAPATAYKFNINAVLGGTPASSQVFYVDAALAYYAYTGPMNATVTQLLSPGTWPNQTWPPYGTVQLA